MRFCLGNIKIESKVLGFIDFISHYFSDCIHPGNTPKNNLDVTFELLNSRDYNNIDAKFIDSNNYIRLSRSIITSGNTALIKELNHLPGLKLAFILDGDKLKVSAYYHANRSLKQSIFSLLYKNNSYKSNMGNF